MRGVGKKKRFRQKGESEFFQIALVGGGGGGGGVLTLNIFDLMVNIIDFSKIKFITVSRSFSTLFISVIVTVLSKLVDKIAYNKESCRPFNLSYICLYSNNDQLVLIRFQCSTFYRF